MISEPAHLVAGTLVAGEFEDLIRSQCQSFHYGSSFHKIVHERAYLSRVQRWRERPRRFCALRSPLPSLTPASPEQVMRSVFIEHSCVVVVAAEKSCTTSEARSTGDI